MKRTFRGWELAGLWVLLIALPWIALQGILNLVITRQETQTREELRTALVTEARTFQTELQIPHFLDQQIPLVDRRFGFSREASEEALRRLDAAADASQGATLLEDLRRDLETTCRARVMALVLAGPGGRPCQVHLDPAFPLARDPSAGKQRLGALLQRHIGEYLPAYHREFPKALRLEIQKESHSLLGPDGDVTTTKQRVTDFNTRLRNFGLGFWTIREAPELSPTSIYPKKATYFVVFHEASLDSRTFIAHAAGRGPVGFRRRLRWVAAPSRGGIVETRTGLAFSEALLDSSFKKILYRDNHSRILAGQHPVVTVAIEARAWESRWRRGRPLLNLLTFLAAALVTLATGRRAFLDRETSRGLRTHLATGFALCLAPFLVGLALITSAWLDARSQALPAAVQGHLERRIELLDHRVAQLIKDQDGRLRTLPPALREVLDLPLEAGNRHLASLVGSSPVRVAYIFNPRGTACQFQSVDNIHPGVVKVFSGFALQALRDATRNAAPGAASGDGPGAMESTSLLLWQTLVEQFLDIQALGNLMAGHGSLQRSPFGDPQQWVDVFFFPHPEVPDRAVGMGVLMGFYHFVESALQAVLDHPGFLGSPYSGYELGLSCYKFSNPADPVIQPVRITTHPETQLWEDDKRIAEASLQDMVGKTSLEPSPDGTRVTVSRPLQADYFLAVAQATDRVDRGGERWRILVFLAVTLVLLVACILATTSFVLTRPLTVFLEATQRAATGDFSWRLDLPPTDEFGRMGTTFNQMATRLIERQRLSRFVSEEVLSAIEGSGEAALAREGREISTTVLFSDIRDFTTLSERHSPETIVEMLNDYFSAMEECICQEGGIIVSFIGDAILAHFPESEPETGGRASPQRALQAAVRMRAALEEFNGQRERSGHFQVRTGIGIATGIAVVGVVGSRTGRLGQTILGPAVDRAVELETASKQARATGIMIDSATSQALPAGVRWTEHPEEGVLEIVSVPGSAPAT